MPDGTTSPLGAAGIYECSDCVCRMFRSAGVVPLIKAPGVVPGMAVEGGARALARAGRVAAAIAAAAAKGRNVTATQEELVQHGTLQPLLYSGDHYSCPECHETTEPVKDVLGFEVCAHCGLLGARDTKAGKLLLGLTYHAAKKPGRTEFTRIRWHKAKARCPMCPALPKVASLAAAEKKKEKELVA